METAKIPLNRRSDKLVYNTTRQSKETNYSLKKKKLALQKMLKGLLLSGKEMALINNKKAQK